MSGANKWEVEQYWKQAKEKVGKTYDKGSNKFWGTVTKIFKRKVNKHLGLSLSEADKLAETFIKGSMNNFEKILESKFGLVGKFLDKPSSFKKNRTTSTAQQVQINRRKKRNKYKNIDEKE